MGQNELIEQYLDAILAGKDGVILNMDCVPQESILLARKVSRLGEQIQETKNFSMSIANGDLAMEASRDNMLLGSLKDLQSSLRHMLWQVRCVAEGDYSQEVTFLGDFSVVFNTLAGQVHMREEAQREKAASEKAVIEQKNIMLMNELTQQVAYYERMQEMQQQLRAFRHDLKNHCLALSRLLDSGDAQGASEYVNTMFNVLVRNDGLVNTGNSLCDAILSEKFALAKELGICIESHLEMAPNLEVDHFDWCILLGNALDNAIEACQRLPATESKRIWVEASYHKGMLNMMIQNSALAPAPTSDGLYKTTKEDAANHGLGLKNMTAVAEKYEGVLQTKYQSGNFTLTFLLCGV